MTNLLQVLRRKASEVRIRQKASEIRHRSCGPNAIGTLPRSLEFRQPRPASGVLSGPAHHRRQDDSDRE